MGVADMSRSDLESLPRVIRTAATWDEILQHEKSIERHWRKDWMPAVIQCVVAAATIFAVFHH